jgi:branched-chain amino acid transport system ATP-binding protein/nonpolar-amino-acid-transporting ATPase
MTSLLQVRNVAHRFRGLRVLKGVTFAVEEGSLTGLIGPNGAGKSTLFNIISGFLQPVGGEIVYLGKSITRLSIQDRSYAGLIRTFQTPQVFGHLTVRENVIAGCYKQGRSGIVESLLGLAVAARSLELRISPIKPARNSASMPFAISSRAGFPLASSGSSSWPERRRASPNSCVLTNRHPD